jgi:hypothetical protein
MDASKAAERDMATINKSEGDKKSAAAKVACKDGEKCAGCENCKKEAARKKRLARIAKMTRSAKSTLQPRKLAEDAPMLTRWQKLLLLTPLSPLLLKKPQWICRLRQWKVKRIRKLALLKS